MFKILSLYAFCGLLLLTACSEQPPQQQKLTQQATILAFGDSLTYGTGVIPENSYPSKLQQLIGKTVINAGVPGELSQQGLERLPKLLAEYQPEMLILIHGGNDLLRKKSTQQLAKNLTNMIQLAKQQNISIVMLSVPSPSLLLSPHPLYEKVATQQQIPINISALADILQYPINKSDGVHPNEKGYQMMAESIQTLFQQTGAL